MCAARPGMMWRRWRRRFPAVVASHQPSEQLKVEVAWAVLKHVRQVAWWVEFFVYLSLSATLLLGGVGITNIMTAAVRSRTREIGLKKAFGAEDRDILVQFLMESLWLSLGAAFVGGILGRITIGIIGWFIGHRVSEDLFFYYFGLSFLFAILLRGKCWSLPVFTGKSYGSGCGNPL